MKKLILIIISLVYIGFFNIIYAQEEKCSKPKVSVIAEEIHPEVLTEVYDYFQTQYAIDTERDDMLEGFDTWQTEEDWYLKIHEYIFNTLQEYNPNVEFISNGSEDGNYQFTYSIYLYAIDVIHPETGNSYSKTGYLIRGKFRSSDACGFEAWILKSKGSEDLDLFQAIKNLVGIHIDNIHRIINNHEKKRSVPPRGPSIDIFYTQNSISPLLEERKLDIQISVYNCKDEIVYDEHHGQKVYCPKRTERGENYPTKGFPQELINIGDIITLIIKRPVGASATYELKKGIKPGKEKFEILTCGRDKKETKTIEIIINGLEILVKPKKTAVKSSENTSIDIYFNTVSPNGKKRPVANKQLKLSVKGIIDGRVSPSKTVTTNLEGKATLKYKAGKNDKKISITASYQPINYPDIVTSSSYVNVMSNEYAWNGSFNIDVAKRFQCNVQEQVSEISNEEIRADDEYTQRANVTIGMNDFDLAINPSIPGTHLIREASGEMQLMMNEDHFTAYRAKKTECYNESGGEGESSHIWVSPGNWSTKHETFSGQASRTIKKENINLLIVKDIELDKDAMKSLQKQMQEAAKNKDYAAIQNLSGQMTGMVQGDQKSNVIPIRIRIEIGFDITKKDLITKTFNYKSYNVCLKENEDDNGSNNIELPIAIPMVVEMKGTFTRGEDGSDIINASVDMTETLQGMFYTGKCPDAITIISGKINLERKRK